MTDRPDPSTPSDPTEPLDELDPATDDAVRRTLADAAGPVPTPDHVVARLDATLADLAAERRGRDPEGVVIALDDAARSRRTRVRLLLGAAAAVVVVGVAAGVLGDGAGGGGSADSATALSEDAPPTRGSLEAGGDAAESQAEAPASPPARSQAPDTSYDSGGIVAPEVEPGSVRREVDPTPLREVRPDRLRDDLVALQNVVLTGTVDYSGTSLLAPADFVCKPAAFGVGRLVGVSYDGGPAVVAFRPPSGSTQVTEVLACGTADVLHSTTLPTVG